MDFEERIIPTLTGEPARRIYAEAKATEEWIKGRKKAENTPERKAMLAIMKKSNMSL